MRKITSFLTGKCLLVVNVILGRTRVCVLGYKLDAPVESFPNSGFHLGW